MRSGRDMLFVDPAEHDDPQHILSRGKGPGLHAHHTARPPSPRRVRSTREEITVESDGGGGGGIRRGWDGQVGGRTLKRRVSISGPLPERLPSGAGSAPRSRSGSRHSTPLRARGGGERSPSPSAWGYDAAPPAADHPAQWQGKAAPVPASGGAVVGGGGGGGGGGFVMEEEEASSDESAPFAAGHGASLDALEARLQGILRDPSISGGGGGGGGGQRRASSPTAFLRDPSPQGSHPEVHEPPQPQALGPLSRSTDGGGRRVYRLAGHPVWSRVVFFVCVFIWPAVVLHPPPPRLFVQSQPPFSLPYSTTTMDLPAR